MEILNTTQACFAVDDDLLDFTLDGGEGEEEEVAETTIFKGGVSASSSSMESSKPAALPFCRGTQTGLFPEFVEEELEWLSNKDAFPAVETCFGILSDNPELVSSHQSPVSVLESSSISSSLTNSANSGMTVASCCNSLRVPASHPVRTRSKRRRRTSGFGDLLPKQVGPPRVSSKLVKTRRDLLPSVVEDGGTGRRCLHCQVDKTPQWRAGPMGPKTLCNACGVRYKSGRLLPEYRPANSPTFSSRLHSNSHRKVVEMRRQKQVAVEDEGVMVNVPVASCGYSVG